VNVFEFIHVLNRRAALDHLQTANLTEGLWIEEAQHRGSIAENEACPIICEAPPLAIEVKCANQPKAETVVDEAAMGLPCKLNQIALPDCDAWRERP